MCYVILLLILYQKWMSFKGELVEARMADCDRDCNLLCPSPIWKKGDLSSDQSVYQAISARYPLTPLLNWNFVLWMPLQRRCFLLIFRSHDQKLKSNCWSKKLYCPLNIFCPFAWKLWMLLRSLFVWSSHSKIFHSYCDVTVTGEALQILTYVQHSRPLNSEGS